jgi:hypothetical protein
VFKALVDVRAKLRFPKLLYVQHCDVSHDSSLERVGFPPGRDMKIITGYDLAASEKWHTSGHRSQPGPMPALGHKQTCAVH